jgi:hypothetical protein
MRGAAALAPEAEAEAALSREAEAVAALTREAEAAVIAGAGAGAQGTFQFVVQMS